MKLFDDLATLERALDVRGQRHTVLAGNLANADTPGFAPLDVDYQAAMAAAETASSGAAGAGQGAAASALPSATTAAMELAGRAGPDGNTVDLDKTMIALAENGMQYGAAARAAAKKLAILRYVASDGLG